MGLGVMAVLWMCLGLWARHRVRSYVDPYHRAVAEAGFALKTAQVNQVRFSYAEGPDSGPPLVLLHAQHMDWFDYSRVLPLLAERFHVYDIDYPGHGATTVPSGYSMTANRIGADLGALLDRIVGEPAYVSGNSSGALLSMWLAAERPDLVRAVLLEDPPVFTSEHPRITRTIAYRSFVTSAEAVEQGTDDFLLFWIHHNAAFFSRRVFPGAASLLVWAIEQRRAAVPGVPVEVGVLPNDTVRLFLRGMDQYDPRFGAAFEDGSWNTGFDHAVALARIQCPVLLLHAEWAYRGDTLVGALDDDDAARALALLADGRLVDIDASHVVHLDEPVAFVEILEDFFREAP